MFVTVFLRGGDMLIGKKLLANSGFFTHPADTEPH